MDTIFTNSQNNKTSEPHRLLLNLSDDINLKVSDKFVALSNLSIYHKWKNKKNHTKVINLKYQLRHAIMSLNYLMGLVLYQIFKITSNIF